MRQPNYPVAMLAEIIRAKGKTTQDNVLELVSCLGTFKNACDRFESQLYSVTHERDRLLAENQFLIRLFNIKQEEQC